MSDSEVYSVELRLVGLEDVLGGGLSHVSSASLSAQCARGGLLRDLGDLERHGLLGRVRVLGAR